MPNPESLSVTPGLPTDKWQQATIRAAEIVAAHAGPPGVEILMSLSGDDMDLVVQNLWALMNLKDPQKIMKAKSTVLNLVTNPEDHMDMQIYLEQTYWSDKYLLDTFNTLPWPFSTE